MSRTRKRRIPVTRPINRIWGTTLKCSKTGKVGYKTWQAVNLALAALRGNSKRRIAMFGEDYRERNEKRYYRCEYCRNWHLTSLALTINHNKAAA